MKRATLIEQKEAIRVEIAQLRRELSRERNAQGRSKHIAELEARLQSLMAEEHSLRLRIDRTPRPETQPHSLQKRPASELLPLLREALGRDGTFRLPLFGDSMMPTLPIACEIEIVPLPRRVALGALVVFADADTLIAHRLVRRQGDRWITQGDGRRGPDRPLSRDRVLGVVHKAYADGRTCWPVLLSPLLTWFWIGRHHILRPLRWIWHRLQHR